MTSSIWSSGHIGWPLFGVVVFSVLCLLATDIVWRVVSVSSHKLLLLAAVVWTAGVGALIVLCQR